MWRQSMGNVLGGIRVSACLGLINTANLPSPAPVPLLHPFYRQEFVFLPSAFRVLSSHLLVGVEVVWCVCVCVCVWWGGSILLASVMS